MYAVYDIAEEYLGYRFYLNDYVYQYADRYVEISEGTYVFRQPAVTYRMGGVGGSRGSELSELRAFARKLNAYQLGGYAEKKFGTVSGPHFINAHSYGYYWRMATGVVDVYFNEDRSNTNDYEAKYDAGVQQDEYAWNPCFTDDYVYATLFRGLLETLRYADGWCEYYEETTAFFILHLR